MKALALDADIWQRLGDGLEICPGEINSLVGAPPYVHDNINKLSSVLQEWRQTLSKPVKWRTIIEMLNGDLVNLKEVAEKVKVFLRGDGGKKYM